MSAADHPRQRPIKPRHRSRRGRLELIAAAAALDKSFYDADREIRVLRGLELEVKASEEIAIVGQSGMGKSTLLHVLGSLETPTAGKVYFEGQDLFALGERALAEFRNLKLGFVFQFHYLLADFTALGKRDDAGADRADGRARGRASARARCWNWWGSATSFIGGQPSFPAASSSASRWRARWCCIRAWCWRTSRPAISIRRPPTKSINYSICLTANSASRWWSRPTTNR